MLGGKRLELMLCVDYSTKLNDIAKIPLPAFDAWTPHLTESKYVSQDDLSEVYLQAQVEERKK